MKNIIGFSYGKLHAFGKKQRYFLDRNRTMVNNNFLKLICIPEVSFVNQRESRCFYVAGTETFQISDAKSQMNISKLSWMYVL